MKNKRTKLKTHVALIIIMLVTFLMSSPSKLQAQNRPIKGEIVSAEDNSLLPFVTISIKGTTQGTTSDINGAFTINAKPSDTLVFSFIGFTTKELAVGTQETIRIKMESEMTKLDEVVVVGYGTESKALLTSSVGEVSADDLEYMPISNVEQALQGKSAGVQITSNSGTPGGGLSVRIRGMSSINAGNDPLYIIDGVPVVSSDNSQVSFAGQGISAISDLNPSDIESISILKDASAAAIYGARATNGVVLITTKKGLAEKTKLSISTSYGVESIWRKPELLNSKEWLEYQNDLNGTAMDVNKDTTDTDWIDEITQTGSVSNIDITASGGNNKTTYYLGGSYHHKKGIVKSSDFERLSGRVNLDHYANDRLHFGTKLMISSTENHRIEGDQSLHAPFAMAISLPSTYPIYNNDGLYDQSGPYANPVAIVKEATNIASTFRNLSNLFADYKIIDGLMFKTKWGIDYYNLQEHSFDPPTTRQGAQTNGMGIEASSITSYFTSNSVLSYEKSIEKIHNFELLGGYQFEIENYKDTYIQGTEFPSEKFEWIESASTIMAASVSKNENATNSYFGRAKYNYKYKYLFNFNGRYDGSSRFGENNKYGFFPGISLAWRIKEESFLKNIKALSELKFKVGYGITGNDRIPSFRHKAYYSAANYGDEPGLSTAWLSNPDLKWESTHQSDLGFVVGLLKDKIVIDLSYYQRNTKDMLFLRPLPSSSGYTGMYENIGEMSNKGIELSVDADIYTTENLEWNTNFNISHNKNEVTKLYEGQPLENIGRANQRIAEGEELSHFYGYKSLGVDPSTGFIIYEDINGDGVVNTDDRTIIGSPHPDFTGGLTNNLLYKSYEFSFFWQFSYGNDIFNGTRIYTESLGASGLPDNQDRRVLDRWQNVGDITDVPKATASPNPATGLYNNEISSRYIEDGSYMRLKSISLAYKFNENFLKRMKITSAKVYIAANNLITFTKYSGLDPEVNYAGNSSTVYGVEFFTYPLVKTYTFGINLTL